MAKIVFKYANGEEVFIVANGKIAPGVIADRERYGETCRYEVSLNDGPILCGVPESFLVKKEEVEKNYLIIK
jgi:hypothetical protein